MRQYNITVSATVSTDDSYTNVSSATVESALRSVARDAGITVDAITATVEAGQVTVNVAMTESERDAFRAWQASTTSTTPSA